MKVTYNWLKDFVSIKLSPEALAHKLTMAGLEVTSLEKKDGDYIFEIEITSNRPDWLSVIGVAREVAAITGSKLSGYPVSRLSGSTGNRQTGNRLTISIENKKDCPLYTAKIIRDVKVGPSPDWLKKRLELIGCRSINNVVDTTNYILFEYGEPLHAFDLDKLVSRLSGYPVSPLNVIVRRAKAGEKIITIDDTESILNEEILVIACGIDEKTGNRQPATGKPIAIAGIIGGRDTEVSEGTKNVLLEAAVFNPLLIRRGRQKLGLKTDSAYRFERGVDPATAEVASWRAARLIQEIAAGRLALAKSARITLAKTKTISLDGARVEKILGVKIGVAQINKILSGLGFKIKRKSKNKLVVEIPRHRQDIFREIDLIEEVSRIFGYENIPVTLPAVKPQIFSDRKRDSVSLIKNTLVGLGLNEVITYSLLDRNLLKLAGYEQGIEVLNPLSREQEILRPALTLSLARCVAYNLNQKQDYVNIFEISHTFSLIDNLPREEPILGIAVSGTRSWLSSQGLIKDEAGFLHLKGILEILFERLGIREYSFSPLKNSSGAVISVNRQDIGRIVKLEKKILEAIDIKNKEIAAVELSLEKLFSFADPQKKLNPLPVYPGIGRDISLLVEEDILAEDILKVVRQAAGPLLKEIKIADFYRGKQVPQGFKNLTISCLYRADDRTLTDAEVNLSHESALAVLKERFPAQIK